MIFEDRMKIRRSLALAAATAAITPAVLLAAPAAFATDSPTPTVTETTGAEGDSTGAGEEPGATGSQTTETEGQPEGTDGQATDDNKKSDDTDGKSDTTEGGSDSKDEGTTPTDDKSTTPSPSASPSEKPGPQECTETDDLKQDKNLRTSLTGLPSKVVAGSGFHNFKLNVKNTGDNAYKRVDLGVFAVLVDDKNFSDTTSHLTLQFKDPSTGQWVNISLKENDDAAYYLGYTDVRPKESFSIDLRLSVDKKAPAGMGFAISIGAYADDKGNCVSSTDEDFYVFDVLAAGSNPGKPTDAKPQGGRKPLPAKPAGDKQIVPQGHLAETGSSSALPMIALAGGAAVAVGAGAVFVVRRRKAGSGAAMA
ncbi:LAETG motif-containing sortase-dependent surface protein [Streptomyces sp. NPDC020792]|uniref:LAETG motif-containing sortase-dependent surface protein n=1 Tax=Streptomyces sp. NPDC020792 TaxID=3365089 RepID=UPI0037BA5EBA